MSNFKVGKSGFSRFINGKGFYIALALCLVAIGSAAYIAANKSFGNSSMTSSQNDSAASYDSDAGTVNWDDSDTQQTANTVSGVSGSSSASSAASTVSEESSSASASSNSSSAAPTLYVLPLQGSLLTEYSPDTPIYDKTMNDWRTHMGVDIAANAGTPVKACADGTVLDVKTDDQLGQEVIIQHGGGITSIYANLTAFGSKPTVKKGQSLEAGDVIGSVGSTAQAEVGLVPHLHFAMMKNGQYIDPLVTIGKKIS